MAMLQQMVEVLNSTFSELPTLANEEAKVIIRERKFSATTLAQSFLLAFLNNPRADSDDVARVAHSLGVAVTPSAVEQRYSPALTQFFRMLFGLMSKKVIQSDVALAPLLGRFTEVNAMDSSVVALPNRMANEFPGCGGTNGSNAAAVKLQSELDLRTGVLKCVQLEPGKSPDQATDRLKIQPKAGSLRLADLGFFAIANVRMIADARAYFLSRLPHSIHIEAGGKLQAITDFLRDRDQGVIDMNVRIGKEEAYECRLIAWRVPEKISKRRIRSLCKRLSKKRRTPTKSALEACNWNFLVTNLPADQLSVKEAIVLYRARWQIELLFKRWKTFCAIDLMDGRTDEITMARFWIRLCTAIMQQWLVGFAAWTEGPDVPSFSKTAAKARDIVDRIALAIGDINQLATCLERFRTTAQILCKRTKRLGKPNFIQLINNPQLLEYVLT